MTGGWEVNISDGMPQKIATAMAGLDDLVGAEYNFIAYLGSQVVNGINHAVLAEQTVLTGRDTKNIVLLIFNEKGNEVVLTSVERLVQGGDAFGGMTIDPQLDIPDDALDAFKNTMLGYTGLDLEPFALVATKVTKGVNYIFLAKGTTVTLEPRDMVTLVLVNSLTHDVRIADVLNDRTTQALGYAFSW